MEQEIYCRGFRVVQFVCGLLYTMSYCRLIVPLLFALCLLLFVNVLINCVIYSFYVCFRVLYVLLSILCVL